MKKLILIFIFSNAVAALNAQSVQQGNQQLYYERYRSAASTFQQVLSQSPANAEAWYGITQAYLLQDSASKAAQALANAPADAKNEPFYKVAYGAVLLQQGNNADAATYFGQALSDTKEKKPEILAAVANAHVNAKNGDGNYAIELLQKAIKRDKKNPALYVSLGDAYRKLHNGSEAYKAYQAAIEKDDKYAAAYHQIGNIFLSQKNTELYLENFNKAIAADPLYAPSIYRLYAYEFYHDPAKALDHYKDYISKSDVSDNTEYELADLLYLNKQYDQAIQKAKNILSTGGEKAQPRLYKLMAYSFAAQKDTATALANMKQYFDKGSDSTLIGRDYLTMGDFYTATPAGDSMATLYYAKGVELEKDSSILFDYYKKLADRAVDDKDYAAQANWLAKYYTGNSKATNVDLFYWGVANIRAENYPAADTVFSNYVAKYPDQSYGWYWLARSKALSDSGMKEGVAIPVYEKLIETLQNNPQDPNYKKWMVEAYGYLAAYNTNVEKDYAEAKDYFEKVLEVEPENTDAKKYVSMLDKALDNKDSR